jgi:hypothetical protein
MAKYFNSKGIKAVAVHSSDVGYYNEDRKIAVRDLSNGKIDVIFCVDIFNEGVDIPDLDTVMFLRPTESYVVFLQQLGRGLRKSKDKSHLTVLDFIGNYKRAHHIPLLLAGANPMEDNKNYGKIPNEYEYPVNCNVTFDFKVLDLFEELKKNDPLAKRMKDEYFRIKGEINRKPKRLDIYEGSDIPIREYLRNGWLEFLESVEDLSEIEKGWKETIVEEFLIEVEKTMMSKSYKIPTIETFVKDREFQWKVSLEEVGKNFMNFYVLHPQHQKDLNNKSNKNWRKWDINKFTNLAKKIQFISLVKVKIIFIIMMKLTRSFTLTKTSENI